MDRKSLIILVVSFILLMLWYPLTNKLFPPMPAPIRAHPPSNTVDLTRANQPDTNRPETPALPEGSAVSRPKPTPGAPEQTLTIENTDARYTFTSIGGGIKLVELKDYPATVE